MGSSVGPRVGMEVLQKHINFFASGGIRILDRPARGIITTLTALFRMNEA